VADEDFELQPHPIFENVNLGHIFSVLSARQADEVG
jgi:hypothetical protein